MSRAVFVRLRRIPDVSGLLLAVALLLLTVGLCALAMGSVVGPVLP